MSIFSYLRKNNQSASVAKERLQIIISHERAQRSTPDYLPKLQEEILAVISKYVPIDPSQVMVNLDRQNDNSAVLELNITMPEEALTASAPSTQPQSNHASAGKKRKKNKYKKSTSDA
ncbi:MAG: cell division topological specificity factor MinE [Gammaproteobacteria bacterium]|nr:cell division topological specificity factor MinE [Gammaproteobacteria bacterium]